MSFFYRKDIFAFNSDSPASVVVNSSNVLHTSMYRCKKKKIYLLVLRTSVHEM